MDMCYDGTLVMPSSYAMMDEEEMSYVENPAIIKTYVNISKYILKNLRNYCRMKKMLYISIEYLKEKM